MYQLPPIAPEEILIYLRKSRADDPLMTVGEVLANHEQRLDEWASHRLLDPTGTPYNRPIPQENRLREVASGETVAARPMIQELLRRIESPAVKAILIVEPQRLSRGDLEDIGRISKLLRYTRTIVITLQYIYDPTDTRDREDLERELKRGNEYLEYTKRILNAGRILAAQNGAYIGSVRPYGYRRTTITLPDRRKPVCTLEPIEEEARTVRLIYDLYAAGKGGTTICKSLNDLGIPAPKSADWRVPSVTEILHNPLYIGKIRWNRRAEVRHVEDGEIVRSRPKADTYILADGMHPAIITQAQWDAVQARLGTLPHTVINHKTVNPLAGLLYCSCGSVMNYRQYVKKGEPVSAPRLLCARQSFCHNGSVLYSELMADVRRILADSIADFEIQLKHDTSPDTDLRAQLITSLQSRLEELKKQEVSLWREKTAGRIPEGIFDRLLVENHENQKTVEREWAEARSLPETKPHLKERIATFREALSLLDDPNADPRDQNRLLRACITRITYTRPTIDRTHQTPTPYTLTVTLTL